MDAVTPGLIECTDAGVQFWKRGPPLKDPLFRAAMPGSMLDADAPGLLKCTDEGVQIWERDSKGPHGVYGSVMWQSGKALAKFFAWRELDPAARGTCIGKTALELGAGTGVAGLTLARFGAKSVTLTDCEPMVLDLLQINIALNSLGANATACNLRLGDASTYRVMSSFDLIVAADVIRGRLTWLTPGARAMHPREPGLLHRGVPCLRAPKADSSGEVFL